MLSKEEIQKYFANANAIIIGDHFVYAKKPDGWHHGFDYVNKDAIYPYQDYVSVLCNQIATHFWAKHYRDEEFPEVIVGPTVGGVALVQWVTYWMKRLVKQVSNRSPDILSIFADEEDVLETNDIKVEVNGCVSPYPFNASGKVEISYDKSTGGLTIVRQQKTGTRRVIKRGYDKLVWGSRCLIVEDVINSGATVMKTRDAILATGGSVMGVGALCNRSGGKVTAETLGVPELFSLLDVNMQMFKEDECPICKERGFRSVRTDLGKGKEFLIRKGL